MTTVESLVWELYSESIRRVMSFGDLYNVPFHPYLLFQLEDWANYLSSVAVDTHLL